MSNYHQYDMWGGQHPTTSKRTIEENLYLLFRKYPELKGRNQDLIVWRFLQEFHGVEQAITPEQFFSDSFPKIDSIRRVLDDVKKTLSLTQ